ncbi:MAG: DMT family transporter [Flavobacteriaceae bacterium]|nr:DMT family transporter [Flavobacteriaceae bacterium]
MIYLLLSILASTIIIVLFKFFERFKVNTLQAIVFNYYSAFLCGVLLYNAPIDISHITTSVWFYGAIALGFLFILIFNLMALTAQRNGLSVASVAAKMSVVIPIIFGIMVYKEQAGFQKIIGILLALVAVYLTAVKPNSKFNLKSGLLLPFAVFLGSGVIDTSVKYIETTYLAENGIPIFSATIFGCAAIIGSLILMIKAFNNTFKFCAKSLLGGLVLGIVNYGSIYYLLKALQYEGLESSSIFTVNNVAIVMLSTIVGLVLFKEHIFKKNWIGIAFAIISILLVTLA